MIVVDTDVLAYQRIRLEPERTALADMVRRQDPDWRVVPVWRAELRNVLTTYMRIRRVPLAAAVTMMMAVESEFRAAEVDVESAAVLALAAASKQSAYDCEYVAAARALDTVLVTGDRRLARAFPGLVVTMDEFVRG